MQNRDRRIYEGHSVKGIIKNDNINIKIIIRLVFLIPIYPRSEIVS